MPLRELQPRDGAASVTCGGCGRAVDAFGRHYSSCKNRGNCWTHRHDCVEMSLIRQARISRARATSWATAGNLFGTPAISSKKSLKYGYRRADIVLWNYYAPSPESSLTTLWRSSPTAPKRSITAGLNTWPACLASGSYFAFLTRARAAAAASGVSAECAPTAARASARYRAANPRVLPLCRYELYHVRH